MDFPKKQAQRLIPLYLLEYNEKLFENHPDPEAPWGGGGGGDYTAGYGIDITNREISVDTDVIATKSDIASMVTTSMLEDALDDYALKTDIPENVSDLNNDAGYTTQTWVENQGYLTSADLSGYVTSSELTSQLSNYALSSTVTGIASQVTTLESLVSNHTTQINSINSNITDLQTLTSTHTSQISGINSSITSLESLVNTNTSNISTIQSSISNMGNTHPFYRVTDGNDAVFFSLDGAEGTYYKWLDITGTTYPVKVNLQALNPKFESGLTAGYSLIDSALHVSLDSSITSSITTLEGLTSTHTSQISALQTSVSNCVTVSQLSTTLSDYTPTSGLASVAITGNYNDLTNKPTIPDAVSGTNDGTNWTTLTIGSDTYDIPQGGSAPGLIGEVLFSRTPTTGQDIYSITLSKNITDYEYVEIYYNTINNTNEKSVKKLVNPAVNDIFNLQFFINNTANTRLYTVNDQFTITNATTITYDNSIQQRVGNSENTNINSSTTSMRNRPYKIIGYKANSSALTTETWTFTLQDDTTVTKNIVVL